MDLGSMMSNPAMGAMMQRLQSDPELMQMLQQPDTMARIQQLMQNPANAQQVTSSCAQLHHPLPLPLRSVLDTSTRQSLTRRLPSPLPRHRPWPRTLSWRPSFNG